MILHRTTGPDDWKAHLAQPERHWKPLRSAMETALAWEGARGAPAEIAALFPQSTFLQAIVEYPVPLPGGDRDSFNDVFALFADAEGLTICMVEAKRDEPFGPTLSEWRTRGGTGREARLAFLCEILSLDAATLPGGLRYQLLHRTVSAIVTARRYRAARAVMVVQSFSPECRWFEDYAAFAVSLGVEAPVPDALASAGLRSGIALSLGWVKAPFRSPQGA